MDFCDWRVEEKGEGSHSLWEGDYRNAIAMNDLINVP